MISHTKSHFTYMSVISTEVPRRLFLLCDQVIEIQFYPLISVLYLSIIFLNLKLIQDVKSGCPIYLPPRAVVS